MSGGIFIALVAIIWLGMNKYFEEGKFYATYFDQSVQGLSVDSPVKYRGVTVGRVDQIAVAPDSHLIMVIMVIDSDITLEKNVLAQLSVVGITGSMFIELDRGTEEELSLSPTLSFPSKYPIIASTPSEISKLFRGLDDLIQQVNELDLKGISNRAKITLDHINSSVDAMQLTELSSELHTSLVNFNRNFNADRWRQLTEKLEDSADNLNEALLQARQSFSGAEAVLGNVQQMLDDNKGNLHGAITDFRQMTQGVDDFISRLDGLSNSTDENFTLLTDNLLQMMQNLSNTANTLDRTLQQIEQNPAQLLFSSPPPPREINN